MRLSETLRVGRVTQSIFNHMAPACVSRKGGGGGGGRRGVPEAARPVGSAQSSVTSRRPAKSARGCAAAISANLQPWQTASPVAPRSVSRP